jgi:hypothetical protein
LSLAHVRSSIEKAKAWVAGLAGLALGYVVAGAVPRSRIEAEAFGQIGTGLRAATEAFEREHAQGAKQVAAEAFGIAKFAAGALGVVAAFAEYFSPPSVDCARAGPADRAVNPSAHRERPEDVVRDGQLSHEQRQTALD